MTFVSVGNVVVDILMTVPALPERGGDVLAAASGMSPGGSFNALVAASRQGLPAAYAGAHGTGFFGDLVRAGLRDNDIAAMLPATPEVDSGYDIALVDDAGERTFVTAFGAEAKLTAEAVGSITVAPGDILHLSGYGLLRTTNGSVLAPWLREVPPDVTVLFDPGPLVADIPAESLATVVGRADWVSCNEREARSLDQVTRAGTITRLGARGCRVEYAGTTTSVPGYFTEVVDTNGAGDAHVGAFAAALAAGLGPVEAAERANACAALAVSRFGPATAPTLEEVLALMSARA
jgi:sugar/nucleoside kinase (ribokinase family)